MKQSLKNLASEKVKLTVNYVQTDMNKIWNIAGAPTINSYVLFCIVDLRNSSNHYNTTPIMLCHKYGLKSPLNHSIESSNNDICCTGTLGLAQTTYRSNDIFVSNCMVNGKVVLKQT